MAAPFAVAPAGISAVGTVPEHARMRIGLSQLAGDLVLVGRNEVDLDLVHLPALIAVVILHPEIYQVAGTNLRCIPLHRLSEVFVDRLGFPRQLLRDGFLLLVFDLATAAAKAASEAMRITSICGNCVLNSF